MKKIINIDWNCLKSIKKAEKQKAKFENKGYRQITSHNYTNKIIFEKIN